jgi:hypothetical protein
MRQQDFRNLKRYPNGDIVDLYNMHHLLTDKQIHKLSDDDWSRVNEYQLELEVMRYECA